MCDWRPVLGWLIATMVALGGAISSVILGLALPVIAPICFGAGATWCLMAVGFAFAAASALSSFCACAAASPACARPCSTISSLMAAFIISMVVAGAIATRLLFTSFNQWHGIALVVAAAVALGTLIAMLAFVSLLASCQSAMPPPPAPVPVPPTPTPPPTESGTAPI